MREELLNWWPVLACLLAVAGIAWCTGYTMGYYKGQYGAEKVYQQQLKSVTVPRCLWYNSPAEIARRPN